MQEVNEQQLALEKLKPFVGSWNGSGVYLEGAGESAGAQLVVTDAYEWLEGNFFLIDSNVLDYGSGKLKAHRILGYDKTTKMYTINAFDNTGFTREYKGKEDDTVENTWYFAGEYERVTFSFSEDGAQLNTYWERKIEGKWVPLCKTQESRTV